MNLEQSQDQQDQTQKMSQDKTKIFSTLHQSVRTDQPYCHPYVIGPKLLYQKLQK